MTAETFFIIGNVFVAAGLASPNSFGERASLLMGLWYFGFALLVWAA